MDNSAGRPVVAIRGASGGVGASTFAAALAAAAGRRDGYATLVDLDDRTGGIDVLLGVESVPGPRWSGLRLAGGHLDPATLAAALPKWGQVGFLAADVAPTGPVLRQILPVAARVGIVVLDLPRWVQLESALPLCDLVVLVSGSYVAQVTAARAVASGFGPQPAGLVVRGGGPGLAAQVAQLTGLSLVGELPRRLRRGRGDLALWPANLARPVRRTADGVLDALDDLANLHRPHLGPDSADPGWDSERLAHA